MKACATILVLVLACGTAFATSAPTMKNLQTAFNGESNAHARYLAFAKEADKEGYGQIASLFRAAARAEEIHANNHAALIKKNGGTPSATIEPVKPGTTAENLKAAIKGESYERDTMYPDFIKQARAEGDADAIETFNMAKAAETEHAALYTKALADMNQLKGKSETFWVCPKCGSTVKVAPVKCPVCFTPKDKFIQVS